MSARFVFFYRMKPSPDEIRAVVPLHVGYWKRQQLPGYEGGPFADRSGGLITFEAARLDEALAMVNGDPFVTGGLLEERWVKEWQPE